MKKVMKLLAFIFEQSSYMKTCPMSPKLYVDEGIASVWS